MKNNLWFKKKTYGWGWTPANAMGWLITGLYICGSVAYPLWTKWRPAEFSPLIYTSVLSILTVLLIGICYLKGEKPGWIFEKKD